MLGEGLIEINGAPVFEGLKAGDAIAAVVLTPVFLAVCAASLFFACPIDGGMPVSRDVSTGDLHIGTNSYRVCAPDGDFLLPSGLSLRE